MPTGHSEGEIVDVTVEKVTRGGVHLSHQRMLGFLLVTELSWDPDVRDPRQILSDGDTYRVRIDAD